MKKRTRKLLIVDVVDGKVEHPGRFLANELVMKIRQKQDSKGTTLAIPPGLWDMVNMLEGEKDEFQALEWYGELSPWIDSLVTSKEQKAKDSLARFLATRP